MHPATLVLPAPFATLPLYADSIRFPTQPPRPSLIYSTKSTATAITSGCTMAADAHWHLVFQNSLSRDVKSTTVSAETLHAAVLQAQRRYPPPLWRLISNHEASRLREAKRHFGSP